MESISRRRSSLESRTQYVSKKNNWAGKWKSDTCKSVAYTMQTYRTVRILMFAPVRIRYIGFVRIVSRGYHSMLSVEYS